jgi:hypothetical protein
MGTRRRLGELRSPCYCRNNRFRQTVVPVRSPVSEFDVSGGSWRNQQGELNATLRPLILNRSSSSNASARVTGISVGVSDSSARRHEQSSTIRGRPQAQLRIRLRRPLRPRVRSKLLHQERHPAQYATRIVIGSISSQTRQIPLLLDQPSPSPYRTTDLWFSCGNHPSPQMSRGNTD